MNKKLEEIVVLYDRGGQGKTSTLRALIEELAGSLPNSKGDIRVIIPNYRARSPLKKVNIFIATCGDTPEVIEDNIRFFNGKLPDQKNVPMFVYENGVWTPIESENEMSAYEANICFSACRSDGVGVDAMHYFINAHLAYTFATVWIRLNLLRQKLRVARTAKEVPDWNKLANELKQMIDNKFAKKYIS